MRGRKRRDVTRYDLVDEAARPIERSAEKPQIFVIPLREAKRRLLARLVDDGIIN